MNVILLTWFLGIWKTALQDNVTKVLSHSLSWSCFEQLKGNKLYGLNNYLSIWKRLSWQFLFAHWNLVFRVMTGISAERISEIRPFPPGYSSLCLPMFSGTCGKSTEYFYYSILKNKSAITIFSEKWLGQPVAIIATEQYTLCFRSRT